MNYEPTRIELDQCIEEAKEIPHEDLCLLFSMMGGMLKCFSLNSPPEMDKYFDQAAEKIKSLLTEEEVEKIEELEKQHG